METIEDWNGSPLTVRRSTGPSKVAYVERWERNVLRVGDEAWPAWLLKQVRGYVARRAWFSDEDSDALAADLGVISKFQSFNSEDAVTWSWFGTLSLCQDDARRTALQWLSDFLDIDVQLSIDARIDQWPRVYHPNEPASPHGPEIDARIEDANRILIYVEAKWDAELGTGKGATEGEQDDQVILRRDSLSNDPSLPLDNGRFIVLGVSPAMYDLTPYTGRPVPPVLRDAEVRWMTWDDLAKCSLHPLADEFRRYLAWKREHA